MKKEVGFANIRKGKNEDLLRMLERKERDSSDGFSLDSTVFNFIANELSGNDLVIKSFHWLKDATLSDNGKKTQIRMQNSLRLKYAQKYIGQDLDKIREVAWQL